MNPRANWAASELAPSTAPPRSFGCSTAVPDPQVFFIMSRLAGQVPINGAYLRQSGHSVRVDPSELRPGIRVKVISDPHALDTWPSEPTGIIEPFRGADFFVATDPGSGNPIRNFLVIFDEPHDDGSGDGPYTAATFDERRLQPIGEADLDTSAEGEKRRSLIDFALREVIEHPERGEGMH
jgi:hypothetical protein